MHSDVCVDPLITYPPLLNLSPEVEVKRVNEDESKTCGLENMLFAVMQRFGPLENCTDILLFATF